MKRSITTGLEAAEAKLVEAEYLSSPLLRKRLKTLLIKKQEAIRKNRLSDDNYASPNWVGLQADAVGYQRAIDDIISLIE